MKQSGEMKMNYPNDYDVLMKATETVHKLIVEMHTSNKEIHPNSLIGVALKKLKISVRHANYLMEESYERHEAQLQDSMNTTQAPASIDLVGFPEINTEKRR